MKLTTRFALAMITLVLLTAGAIKLLTSYSVEQAILSGALERAQTRVRSLAAQLEPPVRGAYRDVLTYQSAPGVRGFIKATLAGGVDPDSGLSAGQWSELVSARLSAELAAKQAYAQFRIIGIADGGRELIRLDRTGPQGSIRVVPAKELQQKGDRTYFVQTISLQAGEVHVSPVELNREFGAIESPPVPVLRVATPLFAQDGSRFGIVIVSLDFRQITAPLRQAETRFRRLYVVNESGDFLLHPDPGREFGFEDGPRFRWQDEFPAFASALGEEVEGAHAVETGGERFAMSKAVKDLVGGPALAVIEQVAIAELMAPAYAAQRAVLAGGLTAVGGAVLLAFLLARSLAGPLVQMTAAVEGFARGEAMEVPSTAVGELGVLARAFARMAEDVREKSIAMQRNAEILDKTIASLSDALLVVDAAGRTLIANPACKELFGDRSDIGSPDWQKTYLRFHADGITPYPTEQAPIGRAVRGESFDNLDIVLRRCDQAESRHLVASGRAIRDSSGRHEGAVIIYRDLTALRETERQLRHSQKMDAVGQLTGGVAHDFNNILTVILGTIDILEDDLADRPALGELARMIDEAATRGAGLTRQLLAFARRQALEPRATDVNSLVVETTRLLKTTLGEQVEIEPMLEDGAWRAMVDPSQLSTALLNLAVNARDAMPAGGKLTIETGNVLLDEAYAEANPEVTPGPHVMIAVSDTGAGIPAAIRDKVFEPFFTTKEVGKGTGLGLSMVYGFVKQSGGHVKIYSEEGHGTTVKLYLPRIENGAPAVAEAVPATAPGGSETILVVEDDEMVRNHVVAQLRSLGYTTLAAAGGTEALALVDEGVKFDLLFTDVIMPGGMNGRQLAEELARRRPSIRVLYTSGYTENAIVHHGRLDPGVALLNKPYRKADLARKLREVLTAASRAA